MVVIFATVVTALVGGIHWYLWKRLVRDVSVPGGWYRRVGTVVMIVVPLLVTITIAGAQMGLPFELRQVVAWPGMYWFGSLLYLVPCLLVGEALRPLLLRRMRAAAGGEKGGETGAEPGGAGEAARAPRAADAAAPLPEPAVAGAGAAGRAASGGAGLPERGKARAGDEASEGASEDGASEDGASADGSNAGGSNAGGSGGADAGERDGRGGRDGGEPSAAELSRRRLVARGVAVGAGVVAAGTMGYGTYAARRLRTKHVTIQLAKLPRASHGYRIAVVSDVHLGPILGRSHCQRVVDALNATQPDIVTMVGDLVDAEVDDLRAAAEPLAQIRSRDGSFFVTGNHEYYVDTEEWIAHVRELGLEPLENERRELPYFDLAGVNDLDGEGSDHGGPDFEAALGDRDRQRTAVLMSHQPATIHDAVDHGVDLQLSGHTHGGQLWPGTLLAGLVNPTVAGLESYGDTQLYVSRGAGSWGPPVRVGADPDITVITLASPEA
ncbi:metallophosphoesterase [Streptomyces sp. 4N509B]|uniref:metallophosphoesterase n=1 Tax=Streptomyces sp. 4N509B TaxID=3457413 RepID=UPI003FD36619